MILKRRDNFIEFFTYNFQLIRRNAITFGGMIFYITKDETIYGLFLMAILIAVLLALSISSFLKWYYRTYGVTDRMITVSSGVFKKFHNDIPFNRVKSINTSDTITKRLFGVSNLNVELIGGERVQFVMKNNEVEHLKQEIFAKVDQEETMVENKIGKLSFFQHMLVAASNLVVFITVLSILGTLHSLISKAVFGEAEKRLSGTVTDFWKAASAPEAGKILLVGIGMLAVLGVITYLLSVVGSYLTYGNFTLASDAKELHIRYGFLSKKEYTIPKKQIRSLKVTEPFFMKMFGYVKLEIENIGLGSGEGINVLFYPIISKTEASKLVADHIPQFEIQEITMSPSRNYLPVYLFQSGCFPGIAISLLMLVNEKFIWLSIWFVYRLIKGYCKWKHTGLGFDERFVSVSVSKQFGMQTIITPKHLVQSTGIVQSWLMRRKNVFHYKFAVYSEEITEVYKVKYLTEERRQEFLNYLKK